ncbi:ERI1 exoribonuclease 3 [Alligator mississippiensis]|uniref:ERI1 exoribonuclease 3 n=1 Tax=Alligator mississippiensis TaxID=8496 RepID=A0A151PCD6_ALLMI|nr:ERI1 exoribonuclease 3 [Alligator mississippiensis]
MPPPATAPARQPPPGGRRAGSPAPRRSRAPLPLAGAAAARRGVGGQSAPSFRCLWMFNDSPLPYWSRRFPPSLHPRLRLLLFFLSVGILKKSGSTTSRKLASHGFGASMAAMSSFPPQRYHYFLVLDFEATCDKPQLHPQEIIEFPILKLNGRTMEIESTFHMYVQPVVHPQLTPFCTELTGIIQGMVDGQPSLQQVLERVDEWMAKEGLLDPSVKSIFVTCGDWDLKVMLPGQCQYLGLPVADYFKQWINLKKAYKGRH